MTAALLSHANNLTMNEKDARHLREFLADRDVECPSCRYNLRSLTSSRCPECDHELTIRVGLADGSLTSYILALIGLAVGAGAAALVVVGVLIASLDDGLPMVPDEFFLLITYPGISTVVITVLLAGLASNRGRRTFMGARSKVREVGTVAAWVLSLSVFAVWMYFALHA